MQEAQRFFRYVVPGLTLFIEAGIYFLLSGDICFSQLIKLGNNIAVAISALLASGAIGFLLGVLYYTLIWRRPFVKIGIDHRPALREAVDIGWLQLKSHLPEKAIDVNELSIRSAWHIAISYWNSRIEASPAIKGATPRAERLADIGNGLGTACISSAFAFLVWCIYNISGLPGRIEWLDLISLAAWIIIFSFHVTNFREVTNDFQTIFAEVLLNELKLRYEEDKRPVTVYVFKNVEQKKRKFKEQESTLESKKRVTS
ncbi:MAG: hypothetical protein ACFFCW_32235 [Candidatus Hodarchaeota archaeon]